MSFNEDKEQISLKELSRLIQDKNPEFYLKDIVEILNLEQKVILEQLDKGNDVKWGKLYKFKSILKEPYNHYDGLHRRTIVLPKRVVIKEKQLGEIKKLYKDVE